MKKAKWGVLGLLLCWAAAAHAQLQFEHDVHDFGTIAEVDGKVGCTFTAVNRGKKPVVILEVIASCGCTVPEFSRKPILPGDSAAIRVTYDPTNRPGAFDKELAVYSSDREAIATLAIRGTVTPRPKRIDELYPFEAGEGVRLNSVMCSLRYIYMGTPVQGNVEFVNTSPHPVTLRLLPRTQSGLLRTDATEWHLAAGERGAANFLYQIPLSAPRYGTITDTFAVEVDGRSNGLIVTVTGIGIDDPSLLRNRPRPRSRLSVRTLQFGTLRASAAPVTRRVTLYNDGEAPLLVRAVENGEQLLHTLRPGAEIAPHDSLSVAVTLRPADLGYGPVIRRLTLITNDPERPMRQLRVTAIVEQ